MSFVYEASIVGRRLVDIFSLVIDNDGKETPMKKPNTTPRKVVTISLIVSFGFLLAGLRVRIPILLTTSSTVSSPQIQISLASKIIAHLQYLTDKRSNGSALNEDDKEPNIETGNKFLNRRSKIWLQWKPSAKQRFTRKLTQR